MERGEIRRGGDSANERSVSRSRDHSGPMRSESESQPAVTTFDCSVTASLQMNAALAYAKV